VDTRLYHLKCQLLLTPVQTPEAIITFNDTVMYAGKIYEPTIINIDYKLPKGDYQLIVEHINKDNLDNTTALIVDNIIFNNISDPKFAWAGVYYPNYPEPWASEQGDTLAPALPSQTYLGWNGKWTLTFDVPVFTWIHKIQNLGWIYT